MKKRFLSSILVIAMVLSLCTGFAAAKMAPTFTVSTDQVSPGETATVTIALTNNPGIASIKFLAAFDSDLTLTKIEYNDEIGGSSQQPQTKDSPVTLIWYNGAANSDGDWTFVTLTFDVDENATIGNKAITLSYDPDDIYNIDEDNLDIVVVDGGVKVVFPPHDHIWGEGEVTTEPGTEPGVMTYTCSVCKETKEEAIPAVIFTGTCGETATWTVNTQTGTLTIAGTGTMENYGAKTDVPWYGYVDKITTVVVADGITAIGNRAFFDCSKLTNVTIPASVTSLGDAAFYNCTSLTTVELPADLTSIGEAAFRGCTTLATIEIPAKVKTIGQQAFYGCAALTSITIPSGVETINDWTHQNDTSLIEVTIPASVTSIGKQAFHNCPALKDIYYAGTEEDWNKITVGSNNEGLTNATIHYHTHTWDEGVQTKAPTCEEKGEMLYTCTDAECGATKTEEIAALGHAWVVESVKSATCTEGGYTHYVCSRNAEHVKDDDFVNALGHNLQYAAAGNALNETCTRCDHAEWGAVNVELPTYPFTGEPITPATFSHSTGWLGGELAPQYIDDNVNVGTATAAIAANEVTALITFDITKAAAPTLTAEAAQTLLCDEIVTGEKAYTFALNNVIAGIPTVPGTFTFAATNGTYGTSAVDGSTLTYTVPTAQAAGTKDSITVTFTSQNYEIANVTVNFEFKNKIDVSDKLSLYKVEDVVVGGGQYDFFVLAPIVLYNGEITEEIKNATTIVYTDAFGKQYTELTEKTPAGTYTFVATYEDEIAEGEIPGHIGTISGELEITKGWPQLGIFGSPDKEYDGAAATITEDNGDEIIDGCEYYYVGESVPVITWYAVDGEGAKTKLDAAPVDVGSYNVEVSLAESDNYQASAIDVDFEITPKPVTITVNDATKEYGTEDPAFTGTVEGLVNDADLGAIAYGRTAADAGKENYGTVELTATYTENANYTVEVVNGKMTITKTQPTLKQIAPFTDINETYTGSAFAATIAKADDAEGLGAITVKYREGAAAATTTKPVNAGTYTVVASIAEGKNYAAKDLDVGTLTIAKADRNLTDVPASIELFPSNLTATIAPKYDDFDRSATVTFASSNTAAVSVSALGAVEAIGNGTAIVTVAIAETTNYKAAALTTEVSAVANAVLGVKNAYATDGVNNADLSAELDGEKIVLAGSAKTTQTDIVVTLNLVDGFTQSQDGETIKVLKDEDVVAELHIDASAVATLPDSITIQPATTEVVANPAADADAVTAAGNTSVDGLEEGAAKQMADAAEKKADEKKDDIAAMTGTVEIQIKLRMNVTPISSDASSLKLDLTPESRIDVVSSDDPTNPVELQGWTPISELATPIEVEITGLGAFAPTVALADHDGDGEIDEALPVTTSGGTARFTPSRFSEYTLIEDNSTVTVNFAKEDGSEISKTYVAADAYGAVALPKDTKTGYAFSGWQFAGVVGTYNNLSTELMAQLVAIGATVDATPVWTPVGGGGGSMSKGSLSVAEAKNGTVSVNANNATEGATITVTAKPDAGYKVASVKVTTKSGKAVEVKENNGIYTFTMPGEDVTVSAEFVEGEATQIFKDVPTNAYYAKAVEWAVEKGITTGTSAMTFSPNASCTRAQMVTFLWRAAGAPETEVSTAFTDVKADTYYAQAVAWALDNGITNGKGKGLFDPDGTVTRAESITMLFRYANGAAGANVKSGFTDVDAYAYYFNAVDWAVNNGITNGTTATTFSPNADCVRAQIVTFLFRLLGDK